MNALVLGYRSAQTGWSRLGAIEAGNFMAKGSGKSGGSKRETDPGNKRDHKLWSDPELKARLHDSLEANAPWRRLRDLEFELVNRASEAPSERNVEVADLVRRARVAEELNQGLPAFSQATVTTLFRRKGPERKKAMREFIRWCGPRREMLTNAINEPEHFKRELEKAAHDLLFCALVRGIVSKGSTALQPWLASAGAKLVEKLRVQLLTGEPTNRRIATWVLESAGIDPVEARDWTR